MTDMILIQKHSGRHKVQKYNQDHAVRRADAINMAVDADGDSQKGRKRRYDGRVKGRGPGSCVCEQVSVVNGQVSIEHGQRLLCCKFRPWTWRELSGLQACRLELVAVVSCSSLCDSNSN